MKPVQPDLSRHDSPPAATRRIDRSAMCVRGFRARRVSRLPPAPSC
ncbi:hypothetical protein C7S13_8313 [Burkholderia cepacia]|nr:hypothetical protein [Burkholderia cepacia]